MPGQRGRVSHPDTGSGSRQAAEALRNPVFGGFDANQRLAGLAQIPQHRQRLDKRLPAQREGKR